MEKAIEDIKKEIKKFIDENKLFEERNNLFQLYRGTYKHVHDKFKDSSEDIFKKYDENISEAIYELLIEKYKNNKISFTRLIELIQSEKSDEYYGSLPYSLAENVFVLLSHNIVTAQDLFIDEGMFSDEETINMLIENNFLDQETLDEILENNDRSETAKGILFNNEFFHENASASLLNITAIEKLLKRIGLASSSKVQFFEKLYESNKDALKFIFKNKLFDDILIDDENTHKIFDRLRYLETHTVERFSYQVECNDLYDDGYREHETVKRKEEEDIDYDFLELLNYSEKWLKVKSFQLFTLSEKEQLIEDIYKLREIKQLEEELSKRKKQVEQDAKNKENSLKQLVDANLQDQYSLEQLKNLLNKDSNKRRMKMNL